MHGDDATEKRITGRRSVDDAARLIIAENSLLRVEKKVGTLAEGQDILSGVLIGRPQVDGSVSVGLVEQTREIRAKQNESGEKIDAVIADMGDLKTAQAEQAKTLTAHGTALDRIENLFATGVGYLKEAALWIGRGIVGALGLGALHLLTMWWAGIAAFFSAHPPVAAAAAATTAAAVATATAIATKGAHH